MKKTTTWLALFLFAISAVAQQKTEQTQFYPSLIQISEVPYSGITELLKTTYNLTDNDELVFIDSKTDEVGFTHYKYQQRFKSVNVEGSFVTAHVLDGMVKSLSGNFRSISSSLVVQPTLSGSDGLQNALNKVNAKTYLWDVDQTVALPVPELVVFTQPNTNTTLLAYKIDVYATDPLYRAWVYVDAQTGQVVFENNRIHHQDVSASGNTLYDGNRSFTADQTGGSSFRLRQTGQGIETYDMNNGTSYGAATDFTSSNANSWSDATGVQAHWGAEQTHGYFQVNHNRNSYNGSGATIRSYVHYANNYVNAFWDGSRMTYGDGNGVNYGPLVSLDIVGHEITHGVTEYAANLVYQRESGALNESFSDIFGEAIENYATGSNDWQMGTDIGIGGSGAIRSMNNPNAYGDPDTYGGSYWYNPNCGTPTSSNDYCGVHINSGVQNKWFYILSVGESGTNDIGSSYSVSGIGIGKAAAIAYRNLTVYLSSSSTFADARAGAIQSAVDLYGSGSAEEVATTNAWYAVGVGGAYGTISYCNSQGNNSSYEWISSVSVGSFTNNSGAAGYSDFTSQTINLNAGSNYSVSLTPGFSGTVYQEYWKVWIDYNADGDFSDAGELVYSGGPSSSTVSGSISVPTSASGTTRMRVSMKWNGTQTECESFSYGEVEDYTVDISNGGGGDTQAPTAPTNLSASGTTQTSTNLSWTASTDNVGVTGYDVYVDGNLDGSTASTSYTVSGLSASTSYNMYVRAKDAAGNVSAQSNTVTVTTQSAADTQPPTVPGNLSASNTTMTSTDLSWNASSDNVGVVDYDVFVDGSMYGSTAATSYTVTGLSPSTNYSIYVVANDAAGNTSAASNTVSVTTQSAADTQPPTAPGNLSASNTTTTSTDLSWNASSDNVGVVDYDVFVDGSFYGSTTSTSYAVSGLSPSTTYSMYVVANDAAGNTSAASNTVSVTTQTPSSSQVVLASYFESGWDGWADGGSDCYRYSGTRSWEGSYSIRIRDNSGIASSMTSPSFDISAYSQLDVTFYFYPNSMENNEDFWLRYYDGSSWTTVGTWARGSSFNNNSFYTSTVTLDNGSYNFPSNAQIRFQCDASGNGDRIYIDQVTVTASNGSSFMAPTGPKQNTQQLTGVMNTYDPDDYRITFYPNPARDVVHIEVNANPDLMRIMSISGQVVLETEHPDQMQTIDVSELPSGIYVIDMLIEDEWIHQKFTKQ